MIIDDPNQPVPPPDDNQDPQDDSELMFAIGQEVRLYFDEQMSVLLAQIDARMTGQSEILSSNSRIAIGVDDHSPSATDARHGERETDRRENHVVMKELLLVPRQKSDRSTGLLPIQPERTRWNRLPRWDVSAAIPANSDVKCCKFSCCKFCSPNISRWCGVNGRPRC